MPEQAQDYDLIRASINQEQGGIPGIRLPEVPLLGSGSQGWVFYAEEADGTPRALKVHKTTEGMPAEEAERAATAFENEGEWLKAFDHPNIVKVFRTGVHERIIAAGDGTSRLEQAKEYRYMLMEYAKHGSVADRIKRNLGRLSVEEAALIILQATEGIRYAHKEPGITPANYTHGLTHGDLNPRNLVIAVAGDRQRVVKVADFGIARRAHSSEATMTSTQFHAFSLDYASANQIATGNVFLADDIYSLGGVTAYELLTGERPIRPENDSYVGYHEAHRSQPVPPMERMHDGRVDRVVEALNEPVLTALLRSQNDPRKKYAIMGEYQADFKEALERGRAEASKERTIIVMSGEKDTIPLTAEQLLFDAELGEEAGTQLVRPRISTTPPPPILVAETELVDMVPRNTNLLKNPSGSRRRFLITAGLVATGALTGGVIWTNSIGESSHEQAEKEKLSQERTAIVKITNNVINLLKHEGLGDQATQILRQLLPYDPEGIVSKIEQLVVSENYYTASWLAAQLVPYNPRGAQKIMNAFLGRRRYDEAVTVAAQLASFAHMPAGANGNWLSEAERVRSIVTDITDPEEASEQTRQIYDKLLKVALHVNDHFKNPYLPEFSGTLNSWAIKSLGLAMAPHNTNAVSNEIINWINLANDDKNDDPESTGPDSFFYETMEELCRALTPYAPKLVAKDIKLIDTNGIYSDLANNAEQRITAGLVPYEPGAAADYIKDGSDDPTQWQTHRWNMVTAIALGRANPSIATALRQRSHPPFAEWLDASIDPTNSTLTDAAYKVLTNDKFYLETYAVELVNALLQSRTPTIQQ